MDKWKLHTPDGVNDILFEQCYVKREIENRIRKVFIARGYRELETPSVEYLDVFAVEKDQAKQEDMFKFFDQAGRTLVLKPDMTIPVARVVATRLKGVSYPMKISYIGNTFSYNNYGGDKLREYTQAGIEFIGANSVQVDAEVIATAIEAVRCTGLEEFQIDIGQVDFFVGIMEELGLSKEKKEEIRSLIDNKDYIGLEKNIEILNITKEQKELLTGLPSLFGSIDVIEKAQALTTNTKCTLALNYLKELVSILNEYGLTKYVSIDLGMIPSLEYYTGVIFRGFTYGIGYPILSGGRYDKLLDKFGIDCPANGFSLGVNMILTAIARQKIDTMKPYIDYIICFDEKVSKFAYEFSAQLRIMGNQVELDIWSKSKEEIIEYAKERNITNILEIKSNKEIYIYDVLKDKTSKFEFEEVQK